MKICPICNREIPTGAESRHHLIPETNKSVKNKYSTVAKKETVDLHQVCHRKIHSVLTNKELAQIYNSIDLIAAHQEIQKFAKWVRKKPIDFDDTHKISKSMKKKIKYKRGN